jgi:multiple sugar transport system ATP-binding protein
MNFLPGRLASAEGAPAVALNDGQLLPLPPGRSCNGTAGGDVVLGLRPEHMSRSGSGSPAPGVIRLQARIDLVQPTGSRTYATFMLGGEPIVAELQAHDVSRPGEQIILDVNMNRAALFDARTQRAL